MVHTTIKTKMNKATPASNKSKSMGYSSSNSESIIHLKLLKKTSLQPNYLAIVLTILLVSCAQVEQTSQSINPTRVPSRDLANLEISAQGDFAKKFIAIPGWTEDSLEGVWSTWLKSCRYIVRASSTSSAQTPWKKVCLEANALKNPNTREIRQYFEKNFQAIQLRQQTDQRGFAKGSTQGLITGYYEPVLRGSLQKTGQYQFPLHRYPPDWQSDSKKVRASRAELLKGNSLKGLELVWVEDPVAAAFMQIQGSGKILLDNQKVLRLGFAGTNNQVFKSFANWLIQKKELTVAQASMQNISAWAKKHPNQVQEMLNANPRYVFFKELSGFSTGDGPIGSIGEPLTAGRSIAVDWQYIPKGAPMFLVTTKPQTGDVLQKMVFAQDTGNAIIGSVRADYFWGSGDLAGDLAGKTKQTGSLWLFEPINSK